MTPKYRIDDPYWIYKNLIVIGGFVIHLYHLTIDFYSGGITASALAARIICMLAALAFLKLFKEKKNQIPILVLIVFLNLLFIYYFANDTYDTYMSFVIVATLTTIIPLKAKEYLIFLCLVAFFWLLTTYNNYTNNGVEAIFGSLYELGGLTTAIVIYFFLNKYRKILKNAELETERANFLLSQKVALLEKTQNQLIHDVKSPLTAIKFLAEKESNNSKLLSLATERVESIISELENKNVQAIEFMNITKVIDLTIKEAIIRYNLNKNKKFIFSKNIKINNSKIKLKNISESQLSRAISNIINNSIEANLDKGCEITILVSEAKDSINVNINDDGKGIESSKVGDILQEGYTTKESGKGLGLYYVKKIVNSSGGSLVLDTDDGFSLNLTFSKCDDYE